MVLLLVLAIFVFPKYELPFLAFILDSVYVISLAICRTIHSRSDGEHHVPKVNDPVLAPDGLVEWVI